MSDNFFKSFLPGVLAILLFGLSTLFFLQLYNQQKKSIRSELAGFSLTGLEFNATPSQDGWIRNLYISREPLIMGFTPAAPLELLHGDDVIYSLSPLAYEEEGGKLRIRFDHSVSLLLHYREEESGLTLLVDLPEIVPEITSVKIPAEFTQQFTFEINSYLSLPVLVSEDITYFLTYPDNSVFSSDEGYLTLANRADQSLSLEIGLPFSDKTLFQSWFSSIADLVSSEEYERELAAYQESLFEMWSQKQPEADPDSIAVFLSMAVERGAYGKNLPLVKELTRRAKWPYETGPVPFMGFSRFENTAVNQPSDTEQIVKQLYADKEYLSLLKGYSASLILDILGGSSLSVICRNTAGETKLSPLELANYLDAASLAWSGAGEAPDSVKDFMNQSVEEVFIPLLVNTTEGIFMESEQGWADTRLSLITGAALVKGRSFWEDEFFLPAGMQLVLSVLQENPGKIPARLSLKGREIMNREGSLPDSVIMNLLFEDRPFGSRLTYESVKGFSRPFWTLSAGPLDFTRRSTRRLDFTSSFALSGSEYIVLGNLPLVSSVYLHNIKWKADSAWDEYKEGWFYDKKTRILYLKVYHQGETEKIRIDFYRKPAAVKPAPAPVVPPESEPAEETGTPPATPPLIPENPEPVEEEAEPRTPQSVNRRLRFL